MPRDSKGIPGLLRSPRDPVPVNSSQLKLAIDEDQISDSERAHTTEQVAYIVFAGEASPPPPDAEVTKYYYAGGARVAMREAGILYYILTVHPSG